CLSVSRGPALTPTHSLSLHDALPICQASAASISPRRAPLGGREHDLQPGELADPRRRAGRARRCLGGLRAGGALLLRAGGLRFRSEEHTSELQSRDNLVCRLLLEKKK